MISVLRRQPKPWEMPAPGLTVEDLDALAKAHYKRGCAATREAAEQRVYDAECAAQRAGFEAGRKEAFEWMWANVIQNLEEAETDIANLFGERERRHPEDWANEAKEPLERIQRLVTNGATAYRKKRQNLMQKGWGS